MTNYGKATVKTGVVIQNNTSCWGGGIHVNRSAQLTMTGGTVTGNKVNYSSHTIGYNGGGVSMYGSGALTMSGKVIITGNTRSTNAENNAYEANNLYLGAGKTVAIGVGGLSAGTDIGVYVATVPVENTPTKIATGAVVGNIPYFHSDNAGDAYVALNGTELQLVATIANAYVSGTGNDTTGTGSFLAPYATLAHAYTAVANGGEIRVLSALTATATLNLDQAKAVTIQSYSNETTVTNTPWAITRDASFGGVMLLVNHADSDITLKNITLDGNGGNMGETKCSTLVGVHQGNVVLDAGTTLQNNYTDITTGLFSFGGGLMVRGDGVTPASATMKTGATITGNSACWGGGVHANYAKATFTMEDGTIVGNSAINRDSGNPGYGGGVSAFGQRGDAPTVQLLGGTIETNLADALGGGVYATMDGTAVNLQMGGDIFVWDNYQDSDSNVYLNDGQTITLTGDGLTQTIGVNIQSMPTQEADVKLATGATKGDELHLISDKLTDAGVIYCDGSTDWQGDQSFTNAHHTHSAGTLWLSVLARVIVPEAPIVTGTTATSITIQPVVGQAYTYNGKDQYKVEGGRLFKKNGDNWGVISTPDATSGLTLTATGNLTFTKNADGSLVKAGGDGNDTLDLGNKWLAGAKPDPNGPTLTTDSAYTMGHLMTSAADAGDIAAKFDPSKATDDNSDDQITGEEAGKVTVTIDPNTGLYVVTVKEDITTTVDIPDTWNEVDLKLGGKKITGPAGLSGLNFTESYPSKGPGTTLNVSGPGAIAGGDSTTPSGSGGRGIAVTGEPTSKLTVTEATVTGGKGSDGSGSGGGNGGAGIGGPIEVTVTPALPSPAARAARVTPARAATAAMAATAAKASPAT